MQPPSTCPPLILLSGWALPNAIRQLYPMPDNPWQIIIVLRQSLLTQSSEWTIIDQSFLVLLNRDCKRSGAKTQRSRDVSLCVVYTCLHCRDCLENRSESFTLTLSRRNLASVRCSAGCPMSTLRIVSSWKVKEEKCKSNS